MLKPKSISAAIVSTALFSAIMFSDNHASAFKFTFSGIRWTTKDSGDAQVGPGPNIFDDQNVRVDAQGLHLSLRRVDGVWTSAEVIALDATGYGTYTWELATPIDAIVPVCPEAVLGLFTWSNDGGHTELDVEVAAFRPGTTLVHSVQPNSEFYQVSGRAWNTSTHVIDWRIGSATITSLPGGDANSIISTFNRAPKPLATTQPHLNLWLRGGNPCSRPVPNNELEVVITSFRYEPSSAPTRGRGRRK